MASYSLVIHREFDKEIRRLPKKDILRILKAIEALKTDPRHPASKKLEGSTDAYRIRSGSYRLLSRIVDNELVILLLRLSHRKDAHK